MKKFVAILLILSLSIFAFACGPNDEPNEPEGPNGAPQLEHTKWQMIDESTNPDYLPTIEFDAAGHFTYTENVFEGMLTLEGGWLKDESGYKCTVDVNNLQGFAGGDIKELTFTFDGDTIVINQTICLTQQGSKFKQISVE